MDKRICSRLRELRKKRCLTQRELGIMAGSSGNYIWLIENGQRRPSLDLLVQLAKVLKVSVDQLAGTKEVPRTLPKITVPTKVKKATVPRPPKPPEPYVHPLLRAETESQ